MTFWRTRLAHWPRAPYFFAMVRFSLAAMVIVLATPASAQMASQTTAPVPFPSTTPPGGALTSTDLLATYLRTLSRSPRDLNALLGAGQAALDGGDPNAAMGFFSRAQSVDPRNGRAKVGLGGALVLLERADDALKLFAEAEALGIAESAIARDRGLAYDLRGDTRRAQRDYALALARMPGDGETIRRYALSLGISGDRNQGLTMLDPLLRRQDQGAWRARAFILAMNGNVEEAKTVARQVMPAGLAASMTPFLVRLAALNPAERAHAVNFGTMPADGQVMASVASGDSYRRPFAKAGTTAVQTPAPGSVAPSPVAPGPAAPGPAPVRPVDRDLISTGEPLGPKPVFDARSSSSDRPSPASPNIPNAPVRLGQRIGERIGPVDPARLPPELRNDAPVRVTRVDMNALPPPTRVTPVPAAQAPTTQTPTTQTPTTPVREFPPRDAAVQPPEPVMPSGPPLVASSPQTVSGPNAPTGVQSPSAIATDRPAFEVTPATTPLPAPVGATPAPASIPNPTINPTPNFMPVPAPAAAPPPVNAPAPAPAPTGLGSVVATLEPESESAPVKLPTLAEMRGQQRVAARKAKEAADIAAAKAEAAEAAKAERDAALVKARAHPARLWVQVAAGGNIAGLNLTWRRIRDAHPALKAYQGYAIAAHGTNRVLAGPLRSTSDARTLIGTLAKGGLQALTYSSEAGEEALKLAVK
jgi:hypothetical protein